MKKLALIAASLFACTSAFATTQLVMGTGGTTGTYYPLGGAISQIVSAHSNGVVNITAQATGASNENINLVNLGDVDLAIAQNDIAHYALNGELFWDKPQTNFKAIGRLWPELIQIAVAADNPAETIADFKGQTISVGAPGSGNEANVRQTFGAYGLYKEGKYVDFKPLFLSYAETVSHFKDRQVDGFQFSNAAPNSGIQEIVTSQPLKFIEIKGEKRDEIIKQYPFYAPAIIPANTYKNQPNDVETIGVQACLFVNADVGEEEVYTITKALYENLEEIGEAHAKGKEISLEHALDGLTVPLHPGAERYFREVGVLK